jgi:DNA-binding NarL/FixJ family response regulator
MGAGGLVSAPIRIVIAEDHEMFTEGLQAMLRGKYEVAAAVRDGADVVPTVREVQPDLVLLDLSLPHRTGLDILRELKSLDPPVRVVVVTMHVDSVLVDAAVRLGASAFVPKDADFAELRTAIKEVLAGRRYLSPLLPRHKYEGSAEDRLGFSRLTPRQQEIVRLIGRGLSTEEIARKLGISVHTVNFHRKNLREQLGLDTDWAVLRFAILVELSEGR